MDPELQHIKCVIVGSSGIGKTCLMETYIGKSMPVGYVPTVADNWCGTIEHNNEKYSLGIWDTGGGDWGERMRPLQYVQTNVLLICFSIVDKEYSWNEVAERYLPETQHHCPGIPFILIGCKEDLRGNYWSDTHKINLISTGYARLEMDNYPYDILKVIALYLKQNAITYDVVSEEEAQKFCDKNGGWKYMKCSALKNEGVEEIFMEVMNCWSHCKDAESNGSSSCGCKLL